MGTLRNRHRNKPLFFFFFFFFFLLFTLSILHPISSADTTTLVYKGCADQKLQDPSGIYSQNLKSLLTNLISQSSQKNFAATTAGDGGSSIAGAYQCRGDLSTSDCYTCVSRITGMLGKLCGGDVAAARVQLSGCYLRYEVVGFKEVPRTQLLYKVCGSRKASNDGVGFEGKRDSAFEMVESGVKSNNGLFYTGSYQSLYVLGQCEGDLGSDDCGDCVKSAEEQVKVQCGDSISAQVYLQGCYVSYSYYPNGVPTMSSSSSSSSSSTSGSGGGHTERTVALAVGGFAALGFLVVCLLFVKSAFKKRGGKR